MKATAEPDGTTGTVVRWAARVAAVSSAVTVSGMVATPLLPQGGLGRRLLSTEVDGGVNATTTANAQRVGTRTGMPFGRYAYTEALRPQVAHVPVIVPLAWFGMGLPAREAATAALGGQSTAASRIALGSVAMTAWDLFLDPQMVGEGYWRWARRGVYRGIPLSNYAGWLLTGVGIMALFEALLPSTTRSVADGQFERHAPSGDVRLVGEYGYMSVMQTLGFARYFRDPLVAAVGGAAMLPISAAAVRGLVAGRR